MSGSLKGCRVMISLPMNGRPDDKVLAEQKSYQEKLEFLGCIIVDSFIHDNDTELIGVKNLGVYYLGKSLQVMSTCDIVAFAPGWDKARGCKFEHDIAMAYGMEIMMLT